MTGSNRLLTIMAIVVVALIAVAAVFVAVRDPATFDPDSPEGAVQAYVIAVIDGDDDAAHAVLSDELQTRCDVRDLRNRVADDSSSRITLIESAVDGDEARIEVEVTVTHDDGPFEFSDWSYDERFELRLAAGEWRITAPPWPYYYYPEEVGS